MNHLTHVLLNLLPLLASFDVLVELSDLVGIHAGGRHFDRSCPVVVEVAQVVGELLNHFLFEGRVVVLHKEVCGKNTALSGVLRHEEEVELVLLSMFLNHYLVDQAARGRVQHATTF